MSKALFTTILVSALILPLIAHADTLDDFVLTGDGHTITYSLPAMSAFPNFSLFNSFQENASATIDGVSGYATQGLYYAIPPSPLGPTMVLEGLPSTVFGTSELVFGGLPFFTIGFEPATNPPPYFQDDVVPTFTPGIYTLRSLGFALQPFSPQVFYTLTITPEVANTPEPSSLVLLATGALGIISLATRRRTA